MLFVFFLFFLKSSPWIALIRRVICLNFRGPPFVQRPMNSYEQPDFAAAEAWGEQLKAFVAEQRRKEKVARRALRAEQRAALAQVW